MSVSGGGRVSHGGASAQIDALDVGIVLDLRRRAMLEDGAVVHHRDPVDDAQRHVEVMLDDDEADIARQRVQDLDQLAPLGRRQPGCRLVEQDAARGTCQRHADLELALLAVGELGDQLLADGIEMHRMGEVMGAAQRAVVLARAQETEAPAGDAAGRQIEIVEDAEAPEQHRVLIGAPHAAADALIGGQMRHILAEEADASGGGREIAGNRIEERRLARAIGAQNAAALAGIDREIDAGEATSAPKLRLTPSRTRA